MLEKIIVIGIVLAALAFVLRRWRASWKAAQRGESLCSGCGGCGPDQTTCQSQTTIKDMRDE
ncbi:FeoB-associated Cys-rich membrane protein [Desulfohalobium retbaense]|jgi:hypothetical protein|uniref:FeoB-associated Cys-rich membrane protein n=1 Tax=Desulfohalobium retbaense (strain ATCC 49708 / DSM 5692 / JCM 16813 / HR100) TaxID=485915 RepID=C8WZZ5_DESRD|nr:FeoB-associated Cys-rich membrane protein [Desulfohalobium retbaense]ACV67620.1 hypothetical protein Dret_0318 [Desulfohalobium retbaense DSM 5692]